MTTQMSAIPSIVSAHMPTVPAISQFALSHIPLPMLALYTFLTSLESIIPPTAGAAAVTWITIYQAMSAFRLTKNQPLTPIAFIRGCVTSFIGVYFVTLLIMMPIRTKQITHYLSPAPSPTALSHYLTPEGLSPFKNSLITNEPASSQAIKQPPATLPQENKTTTVPTTPTTSSPEENAQKDAPSRIYNIMKHLHDPRSPDQISNTPKQPAHDQPHQPDSDPLSPVPLQNPE